MKPSVSAAPPRFYPRPVHGVLAELVSALQTLEQHMADVADNGNDAHELAVVLPMLIEARDVCSLTGFNGPQLLLVEMVRVVEGVIEGDFEHPADANNALMFAAAKLPGYVQRLMLGSRDMPLLLMPVLNDLRAVRGAPLISDAVMRLPLFRLPPDDLGASSEIDTLAETARKLRPTFMRALLDLIRSENSRAALEQLAGSLNALRDGSRRRSVRMLWLIARAVIDGLRTGALDLKPATKTLLGQIERCVKLAVEHGERDLVVSLPPELLRNMLYYCAQAGDASDVLTVVRQRYRLDDLVAIPAEAEVEAERSGESLAPSLLSAARDQVQGELDRVRDAVLAFAHSDVSAAETLHPAGLLLERVCETLGVLGMTTARTTLHASLPMFRGIRDRRSNARALSTLAEALLQGSRLLDSELDRLSSAPDDLDCSQELDVDQSALARMPREERKQLLRAVIAQLRAALESFEVAIVGGLSGDANPSVVQSAVDGLRDAKRALDIVSLRSAHDAFERLVAVLDVMPEADYSVLEVNHPVVRTVAALDLYLRSLEDNDLNGRGFLRDCFTALTEVEQDNAARKPVTEPELHVQPGVAPVANSVEDTDLQKAETAPDETIERHALDRAEGVPRYCVDAQLRSIFVTDAHEQLAAVRTHLESRLDSAGGVSVDEQLRQLFAGIVQRARLAEVDSVAVPLAQIDQIFAHYMRSSASVPAIEMDLVDRTFNSIEQSLDRLTVHQPCDPGASTVAHELTSLATVLGLAPVEEDTEALSELRAVFLDEADELVAAASAALADWQQSPGDSSNAERLMRSLHTLKGSARVAGCDAIADIAHELESSISPSGGRETPSADFAAVQSALDRIAEVVSQDAPLSGLEAKAAGYSKPLVAANDVVEKTHSIAGALSVEPQEPGEDTLRVSGHDVGELAALADDVALHRVALHDRLLDAQQQLDELAGLMRKVEEHLRAASSADNGAGLSSSMQESLRDFDSVQQGVRDQLRMSRAALDAQRQSGTALQDGLLKMRLLTFASVVPRLQRAARQAAEATGKAVQLGVTGEALSIDRSLLARLTGPLEHLVRNAVVHGIEAPEERRRRGKEECGRVVLQVVQQQGNLQVRVADDGRGIDLDQVRATVRQRGMPLPSDDDALIHMILEPGFTTLDHASETAGRGVGLDVVNQQVREAGGNLSIQTQPGSGAVFGMRVPQSLTIEKAVLVRAGDERFALPVSQVVSIEQVPNAVVRDAYLKETATYGHEGASFPVHHLGALIGVSDWHPESADESAQLVLMDLGEQRVALHVDGVIGQRELPVRGCGPQLQKLRGYSGASVLADGDVVLVLDVAGLLLERAGHEALVEIGDETRVLTAAIASCIMVVDDSVTMRRANAHVLRKGGYRVERARNGLDALEQLQGMDVDAFVLDLDMPGMDGFQFLERLRGSDATRHAPVVVVSSQADDKSRERVASLGVEHFLKKPCNGPALLEAVDNALEAPPVM